MHRLVTEWQTIRRSSLAHNTYWICVGQSVAMICRVVYIIFLARLLGTIEYGVYVGALATVAIVSQYSSLGSQYVFLRHVSPEHRNFSLYWGNLLGTTLGLGSLSVALLTLAVPFIAHSYSRSMFLCISIGDCLCGQLTAAVSFVFQAFERMRITAVLSLLINGLRAVLAGLMLWHLHRGTALQWSVASLIVSMASAAFALTLVTRLYGGPEFSSVLFRKRAGEGLVFALSCSTSGVSNDMDKAMLGHYGMNTANGIYSVAYRVVDACTMPITALHAAALPRFFHKGVHGVRHAVDYSIVIIMRTAPLALLSGLVLYWTAPLIPHLLGKSFAPSVGALRWLSLLPFCRSFQLSAGDAVTASGHQKHRLCTQAVAAAFNLCLNIYMIPLYSWRGAAWSSLATDGLLAISNWMMLLWLASPQGFQESTVGQEQS